MKKSNSPLNRHWGNVTERLSLARRGGYRSSELAHICRVSHRQLQRFFRARFGLTPRQFLDEMRLNEAPHLLAELNSIKQVSYELGFNHPSHFIRKFKRVYGCTPMEFLSSWAAVRNSEQAGPRSLDAVKIRCLQSGRGGG